MWRLLIAAAVLVSCSHAQQTEAPTATARPTATATPAAEYKDWFESLKNAIGPEWTSRVADVVDAHDPDGCNDFAKDRRLVVEYVVDAEGVITAARVKESSGLPYLDKVGPETFLAVHKVPPPPKTYAGKRLPFAFNVSAKAGTRQACGR